MEKFHQDKNEIKVCSKEILNKVGINVNITNGQISYNGKEKICLKCKALYLLRHGHTKATQEHMFMSDTSDNSHICNEGIQDILKLKDCCNKYKFDSVVVCSNINRVLETAEIFKSVNPTAKYFYQNEFKGINNKGWENKSIELFNKQDLADYEEREIKHNIFAKSSQGESWNQVLMNCIKLINYLNGQHTNERVLLIGQGSIKRGIEILIGKYEKPWDNYDVKKLYNLEEKTNRNTYGTISCIIDNEKGVNFYGKDREN